ncbi:toxin-antitoxin system YwqK family antitoxin [Fusobacterium sp.]|uniref:toxin-antitoxin system YwqK family antitoxin n=1 Tax=Fusobacterium sp. TaxID=68766 RepID=UPI0025C26D48|nr:toxin-antitoxin system YwqK family antitoxin [Fusobacterium sp.]MCI7224038.1 toxin-antitoxin system YwqK family antitoxin [Fusobacterium sp.]MDY5305212.1 toxin-antitoxin system YwqK family antitoxin [Fusobacterium gastrosuis]
MSMSLFLTMNIFAATKTVNKNDLKIKEAHYYIDENELYTGKAVFKRDRAYFVNGRAVGKWITFYNNGNIKSITNWEDGKLNGKYILYENNGTKSMETIFFNGKENGYYNSYYENGNLRMSGYYEMGKPIGTWEYFDRTGKLTGRTVVK